LTAGACTNFIDRRAFNLFVDYQWTLTIRVTVNDSPGDLMTNSDYFTNDSIMGFSTVNQSRMLGAEQVKNLK